MRPAPPTSVSAEGVSLPRTRRLPRPTPGKLAALALAALAGAGLAAAIVSNHQSGPSRPASQARRVAPVARPEAFPPIAHERRFPRAVRRMVLAWQVGRLAAQNNFGRYPSARTLALTISRSDVARKKRITVLPGTDPSDVLGHPGRVIIDLNLTTPDRVVMYARSYLGLIWQLTASGNTPPGLAPVGTYRAEIVSDAPIGYWRLDDRLGAVARDSSAYGRDGRFGGDYRLGAAGAIGGADRAADFRPDGGTVGVELPQVDRAPGHFNTVELWLRPTSAAAGQMLFGFRFYDLYFRKGAIGINTGNNGDLLGARIGTLRGWHYVVVEFRNRDARGSRLFLDGHELHLSQLVGKPARQTVSTDASISGWPAGDRPTFVGAVDEVAVYNYALSPSRIRAHYGAGLRQRSAP